jgi:tetratricopeptide (TPR) repeat protein
MLQEVRRFEDAITVYEHAVTIFRETGHRHREGTALNNLSGALRDVRRFEEATAAHQSAVAISRETGDHHREGMALNNLGIALREVRRFDEAITAHQNAAAIFRETGDRHREGIALGNLESPERRSENEVTVAGRGGLNAGTRRRPWRPSRAVSTASCWPRWAGGWRGAPGDHRALPVDPPDLRGLSRPSTGWPSGTTRSR